MSYFYNNPNKYQSKDICDKFKAGKLSGDKINTALKLDYFLLEKCYQNGFCPDSVVLKNKSCEFVMVLTGTPKGIEFKHRVEVWESNNTKGLIIGQVNCGGSDWYYVKPELVDNFKNLYSEFIQANPTKGFTQFKN
jgi:hypothetical protein